MFFHLKNNHGVRYLYMYKKEYVPGLKGGKNVLVKSYGKYDDLPEAFRREYEDAKARKALAKRLELEINREQLSKAKDALTQSVDAQDNIMTEVTNFNRGFALHYGHLVLKTHWERTLNLKYKINYLQTNATNIEAWRLNDMLFYLCSKKVLEPTSYLQACRDKSNYLYCPWANITQDNFYRTLDFVYEHREALIAHAVKSYMKETKTQVKVAFFDCTNTWFETPYDDLTWQMIRITRKARQRLAEDGLTPEEIERYLEGPDFATLLAQELELQKEEILRMRGPSKEGRFTQPIVTVALVIDQTGFPIDCKVFAGNMHETHSIQPMLDSLKEKYHVKDVYFVADRGLNATEVLESLINKDLGFVVAQSVSKQKSDVREEMLSLNGYQNAHRLGNGCYENSLKTDCEPESFRYKVCDYEKTKRVVISDEFTATGKPKTRVATVKCKIIYTYSPSRRQRDLADLEAQISKAQKVLHDRTLLGNPYGSGWRALLQTQKESIQDKDAKNMYRVVGLKQDVIDNRRLMAGYSAVVYENPVHSEELALEPIEVLNTYHRLVEIEESFRVMKSAFSIRPVHVRLKERITGHCYLCVLALMLLRCVQKRLEDEGVQASAQGICAALNDAYVLPLPATQIEDVRYINTSLNPNYHESTLTGKSPFEGEEDEVENLSETWKRYEAKRQSSPELMDRILIAHSLKPLQYCNTLGEIKRALGINTVPKEQMLSEVTQSHLLKLAQTSSL